MRAGPWYGHHFHFSIIFEEFVSLFQPTDFKRHFKLNFKHFIRTIRDGQEGAAKSSVGTGSFLDPRWIVFGTPPEAFQKSEAIQGDPAGSRVDRFLDRFWIACWIAAGTATLTSTILSALEDPGSSDHDEHYDCLSVSKNTSRRTSPRSTRPGRRRQGWRSLLQEPLERTSYQRHVVYLHLASCNHI